MFDLCLEGQMGAPKERGFGRTFQADKPACIKHTLFLLFPLHYFYVRTGNEVPSQQVLATIMGELVEGTK